MLAARSLSLGVTRPLSLHVAESKPALQLKFSRRGSVGVVSSSTSGDLGVSRPLPGQSLKSRHARFAVRASAEDEVAPVDPETLELKKSAGLLRNLSFLSFWSQLALSIVSGLILFFSVAISKQGTDHVSKWAGLVGVVLGLLSTFFAHGFNSIAKKLAKEEKVSRGWIAKTLITNNTLNLFGIMAAIIGLQASIGNLVAKSLMTSQGFVYPPVPGSTLASLDIFALQALGNILLSHFISLAFTNILLRAVNKPAVQAA